LPQTAGVPSEPTTLFLRFDKSILAVNRALMIALLAVMSVIVLANVATRYLTSYSIPWSEELARYLMIWLTFLGIGPVLRVGGHIAIDTLQDSLRPPVARVLRFLIVAALAIFCAVVAYFGIAYAGRTWMQATAVMEIPFAFVAAAVPTGMIVALWHLAAVARGFILERRFEESPDLSPEEAASI
jgi:TRAP-type C4-dicarboxylate transport system permease small subunit